MRRTQPRVLSRGSGRQSEFPDACLLDYARKIFHREAQDLCIAWPHLTQRPTGVGESSLAHFFNMYVGATFVRPPSASSSRPGLVIEVQPVCGKEVVDVEVWMGPVWDHWARAGRHHSRDRSSKSLTQVVLIPTSTSPGSS
jgi:hypothetical protein